MPSGMEGLAPEPTFEAGIYEHFKGGKYLALWVSRSSENRNAFFVEYFSLEKRMHLSRPYASPEGLPDHERAGFIDQVNREGYSGPRFRRLDVGPIALFDALKLALPQAVWALLDPQRPTLLGYPVRTDDKGSRELFGRRPTGPYEEGR
jgi:hypothetical protein